METWVVVFVNVARVMEQASPPSVRKKKRKGRKIQGLANEASDFEVQNERMTQRT